MDLIFSLLLHHTIIGEEWLVTQEAGNMAFQSVTGMGEFRVLFSRSYRPSMALLVYGLLLLVGGLNLILMQNTFISLFGAMLTVASLFAFYRVIGNWPTRTPIRAALYACGIAWETQGQVWQLRWEQITSSRLCGNRYLLLTRVGQEHIFHASLRHTPVGGSLEAALAGLPDPNRPVRLANCPYCGETISADSTRCLFCMRKL